MRYIQSDTHMLFEHMVLEEVMQLNQTSRFAQTKGYIQHGTHSVYQHCISVAIASCRIAARWHLDVDYHALIRGALLHDYFLYDWHVDRKHTKRTGLHGFKHPHVALANARQDFHLTPAESNAIVRHMFPLTPTPPNCKEAWIVCLADKVCAFHECRRHMLHSIRRMFRRVVRVRS